MINPVIKDIQWTYRNGYVRAIFHQAKLRDLQVYERELYHVREYEYGYYFLMEISRYKYVSN